MLRIDDTEFTPEAATWLRERTAIQINAPSFDELEDHIKGKKPEVQAIWKHVWQLSVSGESVTLPQSVAADPAKVAEAKKAAYWVRRPD